MLTHKHHIVPRHCGGTDDADNIVELSIEEHAEAHRVLYEKDGRWQDYLAWKGLSGLVGKDDLLKLKYELYRGPNHHSYGIRRPEHAELMRERMTGENNPMFGRDPWNKGLTGTQTGSNPAKAHPGNQYGKGNKGRVQSEEWKRKRLDKITGRTYNMTCPHCNKTGGRMMLRWHFDNCKLKDNNE